MDNLQDVYIIAIYNNQPPLLGKSIQILIYNQKVSTISKINPALSRIHPSSFNPLEDHISLFDQVRTIIYPTIHHHKVLSVNTTLEPANFPNS